MEGNGLPWRQELALGRRSVRKKHSTERENKKCLTKGDTKYVPFKTLSLTRLNTLTFEI